MRGGFHISGTVTIYILILFKYKITFELDSIVGDEKEIKKINNLLPRHPLKETGSVLFSGYALFTLIFFLFFFHRLNKFLM